MRQRTFISSTFLTFVFWIKIFFGTEKIEHARQTFTVISYGLSFEQISSLVGQAHDYECVDSEQLDSIAKGEMRTEGCLVFHRRGDFR